MIPFRWILVDSPSLHVAGLSTVSGTTNTKPSSALQLCRKCGFHKHHRPGSLAIIRSILQQIRVRQGTLPSLLPRKTGPCAQFHPLPPSCRLLGWWESEPSSRLQTFIVSKLWSTTSRDRIVRHQRTQIMTLRNHFRLPKPNTRVKDTLVDAEKV